MQYKLDQSLQPFTIPGTVEWMLNSENRKYRIMMWIPDSEAPKEGFPVYYLLDGNAIFATFTEAVRMKATGPRKQQPAVVVGIGYPSDTPFDTKRRFMEYTTFANPDEMPVHKQGRNWPANGGVDQFLDFIKDILMPSIASHVNINQERQALFGHSLGGFCTLYTLFTRPYMFQYYAAGSPSVWWKNNVITHYCSQFNLREGLLKRRLFIGIGSDEHDHMVKGNKELSSLLTAQHQDKIDLTFKCFTGENHISVLLPFISRVIRDFQQTEI